MLQTEQLVTFSAIKMIDSGQLCIANPTKIQFFVIVFVVRVYFGFGRIVLKSACMLLVPKVIVTKLIFIKSILFVCISYIRMEHSLFFCIWHKGRLNLNPS